MPGDGSSLADGVASLFGKQNGNGHAYGLTKAFAGAAVKRVTIRTQFTPPITFEPAFEAGPDGEPVPSSGFSFGALVRPSITVEGAFGQQHYAPYGEPSANYVPYMLGGAAAVFAAGSLFCGAMKVAKWAAIAGAGLAAAGYLRNTLAARSA